MDKLNFIRDGMIRLPPGFRFQPTDEEIVFQYLKRKVFSCPLPASIIPEIDVWKHDPWDLPGNLEEERYFFSNTEAKYRSGNRINRATTSGYWKSSGVHKPIASSRNDVVGIKKTLIFYKGKSPNASKTDWIMHEYRLRTAGTIACNFPKRTSTQQVLDQMDNWVLCRIFWKKKCTQNDDEIVDSSKDDNILIGHINLVPVSSSSSSSSSSITPSDSDNEESSCNILPTF
ncbi:NAM domain-containing protein [Cephalotus follicularis]|uniref:NAM domain-containing protein n=1 Tax=Cephalotus follicularis TaxID=3775 RepID=A0A1Q3C3R1_CEPFO|nr:NAM domain-containing protein [Cephalotus follicularis]